MKFWKLHLWTRKLHRYLGVVLGIQFLMWTVGGLYFSWSNIEEIHGDNIVKENHVRFWNPDFISLDSLLGQQAIDSIQHIEIATVLSNPYYKIRYIKNSKPRFVFFNALTGMVKSPLSSQEAQQIVINQLKQPTSIQKVEYLTQTLSHHEYRGGILPAYACTLANSDESIIYVGVETCRIEKVRTAKWRVFDFFWMLHTMDYQERDNFNHILLRIFSLLGIVTLLSGFLLFILSSSWWRRRQQLKKL